MRLRSEEERKRIEAVSRKLHEAYLELRDITEEYDRKAAGTEPVERQGGNE